MVVKTSNKSVFYETALNKVVNIFSVMKWFSMHKMNYNLNWHKYVCLKLRREIASFLNISNQDLSKRQIFYLINKKHPNCPIFKTPLAGI